MSQITDPSRFGVTTTSEGQSVVLALRGRVENQAAFQLGAILDSTIDGRPESVILDLSDLDFMGAAGMVAISNAERRLVDLGVSLTVRSPSVLVNRLLAMMETAEETRLERALPAHGHLGPEDMSSTFAVSERWASSMSSTDPRRVSALPADPDVVDGALRLVVELTRSCVSGADGVSVSLLRHGRLSTVAASDQTIMAMDADQYATGEGPCVDASLEGHWFHSESLDTETRWPSFIPRARVLGIKAILSSPLKAFGQPVGALNIYSRTPLAFTQSGQEMAALFATETSSILKGIETEVGDEHLSLRLRGALRTREVIAQAQGVLMERDGMAERAAYAALRRSSLDDGSPLQERAAEVVMSTRRSQFRPDDDRA